ncbi:hypothetical protein QUA24_04225 [Microcoleus sp. Pol12B5]
MYKLFTMLSGLVERTLLGGFMYRVEYLVFAAVSILYILIGYLPQVFFSNVFFRSIYSLVLIVGIGLVVWMFFTNSGKTFARNYNSKLQRTLTVEGKLFAQGESLIREISFDYLMNKFRNLSTFSEVAEWDKEAEVVIAEIVNQIKLLDTVVLQYSNVNTATKTKFKQKYQEILENMALKLQESIDFTPNNSDEQKALLKELYFTKKELQLQKKEVASTMKNVNERARSKSVRAGGNFLGIYNSKIAASERRNIRYQRDAQLRPNEAKKAAIDRQILQIEKDILSVKRFTK